MSLHYVIDGYNLLNHQLFPPKARRDHDPIKTLITFIKEKRLTGSAKNKITLVLDGYPPSGSPDAQESNTKIIFSRKISADEKIKQIIEETAQRKAIAVVSDDKEVKFVVRSLGVQAVGIEEFIGKREKSPQPKRIEALKTELNYSQKEKINQELSKLWLK